MPKNIWSDSLGLALFTHFIAYLYSFSYSLNLVYKLALVHFGHFHFSKKPNILHPFPTM